MIRATDIIVSFNPNTLQGSRSLGYGQVNILGIIISYTVYPSNFGLGFMVSYPSKPSIKNGVHELDAAGKPKYFKEVYIQNIELRNMIDNAVQNAMANKGVYVNQPAQQAAPPQQNNFVNPVQFNAQQNSNTFQAPASNTFTQQSAPVQQAPAPVVQGGASQGVTPAPVNTFNQPLTTVYQQANTTTTTASPGSSIVADDDLPF
jgi:hypothetical protein